MNTIGTGSGISGSRNSDMIIRNTAHDSFQLKSAVSDQTINNISFGTTVYFQNYTISGDGEIGGSKWLRSSEIYKEEMYIIAVISYNYYLYKVTYDRADDGDLIMSTKISTPFTVNADIRMIQFGNYLYFASYETYLDQPILYRFDGTTFTNMNSGSDLGKYLFGSTISKPSGSSATYKVMFTITPTQSTKYDGDLCLIDYFVYTKDTTYTDLIGYSGIFLIDDDGFHLKDSRKIYDEGYESSYVYKAIPYAMIRSLFVDEYTYIELGYTDSTFTITKSKVTFTRSTTTTYERSFTVLSTTQIWESSSSYPFYALNRASYPDRKSYVMTLSPKPYYSASVYVKCNWYSAEIKDGDFVYTPLTISGSPYSAQSSYLTLVLGVTNPFVFELVGGINAQRIDADVTYKYSGATFQFTCILCKGDTVYCDDGILTCKLNDDILNINNAKYTVTSDGIYTFETNANNQPDIPSVVITNDKGVIIYCNTRIEDDGRMTGYLLSGMTVNGEKVTTSQKSTYGPSNRYLISFK